MDPERIRWAPQSATGEILAMVGSGGLLLLSNTQA
jgi:hypothetical protein